MKHTLIAALAVFTMLCGLPAIASASTLQATIDISDQTMTVRENGRVKYRWKVSTARRGYVTPVGSYKALWLSKNHRSRKYDNAPMPYSVFFHGGYAVHGTTAIKNLGQPASHGCVRLHPDNAAVFYSLVEQKGLGNTRIVVQR